jgi:hypothetical protein
MKEAKTIQFRLRTLLIVVLAFGMLLSVVGVQFSSKQTMIVS